MIIAAEPSFSLGNCRPPQIDQLCRGHLPSASQFSLFHHRLLIFQTLIFFILQFQILDFSNIRFSIIVFSFFKNTLAHTLTHVHGWGERIKWIVEWAGLLFWFDQLLDVIVISLQKGFGFRTLTISPWKLVLWPPDGDGWTRLGALPAIPHIVTAMSTIMTDFSKSSAVQCWQQHRLSSIVFRHCVFKWSWVSSNEFEWLGWRRNARGRLGRHPGTPH